MSKQLHLPSVVPPFVQITVPSPSTGFQLPLKEAEEFYLSMGVNNWLNVNSDQWVETIHTETVIITLFLNVYQNIGKYQYNI